MTQFATPRKSEQVFCTRIFPADANPHGTVFGGKILSIVDSCAGISAERHAGRVCVTVSMEEVSFRAPVHVGELVTCQSRVVFVGRTSLLVKAGVTAERVGSGEVREVLTCYLTFVALDAEGTPTLVPPLVLETDEDKRCFEEGAQRREFSAQSRRVTD